jgi:4-hydroxy-tetrahydrodipicolinate synthase
MGGKGCISVTANVAPRLCAHAALFSDASPGPVKYTLNQVRPDFPAALRLPMTPPSEASRKAVDAALDHAGLV